MTPAEPADARPALAKAKPDVAPLHPYTVTVARGVSAHAAHIDDLIASHLQGWTLERLPAVDRAILRVRGGALAWPAGHSPACRPATNGRWSPLPCSA